MPFDSELIFFCKKIKHTPHDNDDDGDVDVDEMMMGWVLEWVDFKVNIMIVKMVWCGMQMLFSELFSPAAHLKSVVYHLMIITIIHGKAKKINPSNVSCMYSRPCHYVPGHVTLHCVYFFHGRF